MSTPAPVAVPAAAVRRKCACELAAPTRDKGDERRRQPVHGLQRRLVVGRTDDPLEVEADRAAERVLAMSMPAGTLAPAPPVLSRVGAAVAGGQDAPDSVQRTLQSTGEPLAAGLQARFGPRFGHDFGCVRVHRDGDAARSADEVGAAAYTVGEHLVFATGRYAPDAPTGVALIAHELTHVVQQGAAPPVLQRRGFFEQLAGLFAGDTFNEPTLQAYLEGLRRSQRIEDFTDSDNKARAVVDAWKEGDSPYVLTEDLKALLILEMLSGFTGDDDERAILELLERSFNFELTWIFGGGGVTVDALNGAFQGDEQDCLDDFFARRFVGGAAALAQGTVQPQGDAVPFGDAVPTRCALPTSGLPGFGVDWSLPCVLGILCSEDEQVVEDLRALDVRSVSSIDVEHWAYDGSAWSVTETRHPAGAHNHQATPPEVRLRRDRGCTEAARTLVHEVRHQNQPPGTRFERERDAYVYTEQWAIDRSLPGYGNALRTTDPATGDTVVDTAAAEAYVRARYPGTATAGETIVGHRSGDDYTEVLPAGGSSYFRPPAASDSHWGDAQFLGERVLGADDWVCPGPGPQPELPEELLRRDFNDRIQASTREI